MGLRTFTGNEETPTSWSAMAASTRSVGVSPIPRMTPAQRSIPASFATPRVRTRSAKVWVSTISGKNRGEVSMLWL